MKNRMNKLAGKMNSIMIHAHAALEDSRGEGYVDTAVKILMAVVIGALVLAGLYPASQSRPCFNRCLAHRK